jgi:Mg2+-importing ATPase
MALHLQPELGAMVNGLSSAEAASKLMEVGPNEPVLVEKQALVLQVLRRFANPLIAILVFASVVSAIVRDVPNAIIIIAMVVLSVVVEFVQTHRSEAAAEALRAQVAPTATVMRDGKFSEVLRREVVPGDVVRLSAGDMVPGDAELLEAKDLHLNEAALTGESLPVEKFAGPLSTDCPPASDPHRVLMGTSVVSGTGTARVVATGPSTAFGEIAHALALRPPMTEFEHGITRFGLFILKTVLFLILFVFVVAVVSRQEPLESLLFAVALAVGLTPEFLPMITTVTLARSAVRMSKKKLIVKNLAAIQNFGGIDILCSDKTGTLTTGEMSLERHTDPRGAESERPVLLGAINSYFESGIENPLDAAVLEKARLDPLDSAVLRHEHPDISGYTKVDEIPFDFERRRVSVIAARDGAQLLVTKGAPEHVMAICTRMELDGKVHALDEETRRDAVAAYQRLGGEGFRVLAVAYASATGNRTEWSKSDEHDLVLAGFLAFADPPRADACELVKAMKRVGVDVKLLTGDSDLVATHVCDAVGISTAHAVRGSEIDALSDTALAIRAGKTHVFSRLSPTQKKRVIAALRARGHVVGFLGDGINDAPSLRSADVGISVSSAVDIAKDAADIILLEPGLRVLRDGIIEGRRAFGNVTKYLLMGTSSNFGNMFSMAGAIVLLPFLPMLPTQILLNNFLYDLAQITIPSDNVDASILHAPQRWDIGWIRRVMLWLGPVSSAYDLLTFWVLRHVFHAGPELFHTGWFVESLATQTLVIFVIRTWGVPWKSRPSLPLTITTLSVVGFALVLAFTPLGGWLGFVPLPPTFLLFLGACAVTYLAVVELVKRPLVRRAFKNGRRHAHASK